MKTIGNILWVIFGGLEMALAWALAGIVCFITIIGIPFGTQCFKNARLAFWPFGKTITVKKVGVGRAISNILWILFFGWELALGHIITGLIMYITIIGIPFGKQHFKLAYLSLFPFGARFEYE